MGEIFRKKLGEIFRRKLGEDVNIIDEGEYDPLTPNVNLSPELNVEDLINISSDVNNDDN